MIPKPIGWKGADRFKEKTNSSSVRTQPGINYNVYRLTLRDWLKQGTIGGSLAGVIAWTFYRSLPLFLILLPAGVLIYPQFRKEKLREERRWRLMREFKEAIWITSGYLSAGLSVENAFVTTLAELRKMYGNKAMITEEYAGIVRGLRLNKPVEGLLMDFADRSGLQDIRSFAEVFSIAKRSGGSMRDIIERTTGVIRDRTQVMEEIRLMTAAKRYEQNIMNILPFAIVAYINLTSGSFLDVMYHGIAGRAAMTVCLALLGLSCWLSARILDIRV